MKITEVVKPELFGYRISEDANGRKHYGSMSVVLLPADVLSRLSGIEDRGERRKAIQDFLYANARSVACDLFNDLTVDGVI